MTDEQERRVKVLAETITNVLDGEDDPVSGLMALALALAGLARTCQLSLKATLRLVRRSYRLFDEAKERAN